MNVFIQGEITDTVTQGLMFLTSGPPETALTPLRVSQAPSGT